MTQPQDEAPSRQQRENEADGHRPIKPAPAQEAGTPRPDLLICDYCSGAGQDNDGEAYLNAPCPKCHGSGHFVNVSVYATVEADRDRLAALVETGRRLVAKANEGRLAEQKELTALRSSLATAERERDLFRGVATLSNDSETKEIAETVAQFIAVHEQLKADLSAAQKERDELIAQLHVIFTELKKIPCLQGEGPRKGAT